MFDWLHPVILFGIQRPVIFLGRCRLELFFIQVCRGFFFCYQGRLYFSFPLLSAQANVDRNTTAVEFPRNTTGELDGKPIIERNQQGKFA